MSSLLDQIGKVDNLNDPVPWMNRREVMFGLVISFVALSSLCAFGRLTIRATITRNLGLDDGFIFLTLIMNIAACTTVLILVSSGGLGKHFLELGGLDGIGKFFRIFYVANGFYPVSAVLIKLALLFQYLRMLEKGSKLYTISVATIFIVSLWGIAFTILAWMPCLPVYAFWDLTVPDDAVRRYGFGSHDTDVFVESFLTHAGSNMFLDFIVFAIPMPLWINNNVERKTRLALIGLFVLGAIVNVCSVVRLITLIDSRATTSPTFDPSWYGPAPIVLSVMEIQLATICASLPVFWPIVKDAWESKRIVVTHEVDIRNEPRKVDEYELRDGYDMYSLQTTPSYRPWEKLEEQHRGHVMRSTSVTSGRVDYRLSLA